MRVAALLLLLAIVAMVSFIWGWEVQRKQTLPYRTVFSILKWVNQESPYAVWKDERRNPEHKIPGAWASDASVHGVTGERASTLRPDETIQLQALGYLGATETATGIS